MSGRRFLSGNVYGKYYGMCNGVSWDEPSRLRDCPGCFSKKRRIAFHSGSRVVELVRKNITPEKL